MLTLHKSRAWHNADVVRWLARFNGFQSGIARNSNQVNFNPFGNIAEAITVHNVLWNAKCQRTFLKVERVHF
jgi:phosphosulfolactate synthase (CoM biosynthesis protein A)